MTRDRREGMRGEMRGHRLLRVVGAALMLAGLPLAGCSLFVSKQDTLRYRLTVEVETPWGLKTGSSVMESWVEAPAQGSLRNLKEARSDVFGEAVAVPLGDGRTLFALREGPWQTRLVYDMVEFMLASSDMTPPLPSHPPRGDWVTSFREAREVKPFAVIPAKDYPYMVTFGDNADPRTVREVDPGNLSASLGPGFILRRVTVQVTDESLTTGVIEKELPWFSTFTNYQLVDTPGISRASGPEVYHLHPTVFKYMERP